MNCKKCTGNCISRDGDYYLIDKFRMYNHTTGIIKVVWKCGDQTDESIENLLQDIPNLVWKMKYEIGYYAAIKVQKHDFFRYKVMFKNKNGKFKIKIHNNEWCKKNISHLIQ